MERTCPGLRSSPFGNLTPDFDLDFHAIMYWDEDAALEKHYVPSRSQRARSVLTFFAQDASTRSLI